ncbi:MAG: glycoside hydrolase family 3 N-terminal domain-containing protein [Chloroflexota bacterium]
MRTSSRLLLLLLLAALCLLPASGAARAAEPSADAPPLTGIAAIAAGPVTACALIEDGTVRCWGANGSGEAGDGTTGTRTGPVPVAGVTGATAVSVGWSHACAVLGDGSVRCWGRNADGRLGDGTTLDRPVAVGVAGVTDAIAVAAGERHTCALIADGTVACWGANPSGQLGDGTTDDHPTPVAVTGLTGAVAIAAGYGQSCAVIEDGTVRCWGGNWAGQLGDGTTTSSPSPVAVAGVTAAVGVATGYQHTCAVLADGGVRCWGWNRFGMLGDGSTTLAASPVTVPDVAGAIAVAAGGRHSCALLGDGTARCWGGNEGGQLGDGTFRMRTTPGVVTGLADATAIATGWQSCARIADGTARCWGANDLGQLGIGGLRESASPVDVPAEVVAAAPPDGIELPRLPRRETPPDARVEAALARLAEDDIALVGQLLAVSWEGDTDAAIAATLTELRPGGLVLVGNTRESAEALRLNSAIARIAAEIGLVPPLRAVDHEGGRIQAMADLPNLGSNAAFASTEPTTADACARGLAHASELRALGFELGLAPVLDVLVDPRNDRIGDRAYGRTPELVGRLGAAYLEGIGRGGLLAVAKHFPGHGATSIDSHLALPVVPGSTAEIAARDLPPFVEAIAAGVGAVMVGHLAVPALDPSGTPASLSAPIVTGLLRERLGFDGLVISDDLGVMAAITDRTTPGEAAVAAIAAGVDLLLLVRDGENLVEARDGLLAALRDGTLPRARVLDAARHVLAAKAHLGLLGGDAPVVAACPAG